MDYRTVTNDLFDLSDRVAVVTGGSRGLGGAIAQAFASRGAEIVVASRKLEACAATAAAITERTGKAAIGIGYHAGRWEDASGRRHIRAVRPLRRAREQRRHVAALPVARRRVRGALRQGRRVNLKGPFRLSTLFGARMAAGDGGSIINVSSIAAVQRSPTELPYAAAKAALNAMTIGLSREFAPRVRCNVIMPGPFLTDVSKAWDMEAFDELARRTIPLGRGGQPDELVGAALLLASSASNYITGAVIKVDGGMAWSPG
jgi:NAD(P)-dependent dehydrogenase (short-subunit alcohol dehydrogenase family)